MHIKRNKKIRSAISVITAVFMIFIQCFSSYVQAAGIDTEKNDCSVSVVLTDGENYISGSQLELYMAAAIDRKSGNEYRYVYKDAFKQASETVDISGSSIDFDSEKQDLAAALEDIIKSGGVSPDKTVETGSDGRALFTGLTPGMYLIRQKNRSSGYYRLTSFVVTVPVRSDNGTGYEYNVNAVPKMEKLKPFRAYTTPEVQQIIEGDPPDDVVCKYVIVRDKDSYPMPEGSSGESSAADVTDNGTAQFGTIIFTDPGTYSYTVYEMKGTYENLTYDGNVYKIIYEVDENAEVTKYVVWNDVKIRDGERAVFTNIYDTETIKSPAPEDTGSPVYTSEPAPPGTPEISQTPAASPYITPVISGSPFITPGTSGSPESDIKPTETPENTEMPVRTPETPGNSAKPSGTPAQETETQGSATPGVTETPVTVSVHKNPSVTKIITGNVPNEKEKFTFIIRPGDDSYPAPEGSKSDGTGKYKKVSVNGAGSAQFGKIKFNAPGKYTYIVKELKGNNSKYSYDTGKYRIVYKVGSKGGTSMKVISPSGEKISSADGAVINNKYKGKSDIPQNTPGPGEKPESPPGKRHGTPRLPQTGQLWWPVWVMSCAGVILIIAGCVRNTKKSDPEH